jgi:hypothetical protein
MNATVDPHERFEELAAGYALGALEPEDEHTFADHVATCERCAAVTAEFSDIAAGLAVVSDDIPAPTGLWEGIRGAIAAESTAGGPDASPVARLDEHRRTRVPRRLPALTAAAASVAVLAIGTVFAVNHGGGSAKPSGTSAIADCRNDTSCRTIDLVDSNNSTDAVALVRGQDVTLVTTGLAAIDPSRETYVLWQMPQGGVPAAVLAFAVTPESKRPVASGHLPLPTASNTGLAVSRERGTSIPDSPSAPIATTSA